MQEKRKGLPGRLPLPMGEKRIQRTITISQAAETIVQGYITRAGGLRKANISAFIDGCITGDRIESKKERQHE